MGRKLLGTKASVAHRTRIYLASDAVEADEIEGYTGTRKRVLFDEVLLLTLDRRRSTATLVVAGLLGASLSLIPLASMSDSAAGLGMAATLSSPFWLIFLVHLAVGTDFVTVFGKRTVAQMAFTFRKGRARAVFALLRERIAEAQDLERRRIAGAQEPPVSPASQSG